MRQPGRGFSYDAAPVPLVALEREILRTRQAALAFSGLSVDDFIKKPTFQYLTREGLAGLAETVITLAEAEGLPIHAQAVRARLK